jgi:hypothetical protein
MTTPPATCSPPAEEGPPGAAPPPCWCGQAPSDHAAAGHDHGYAPAAGIESEAYQAW